MVVTPKVRSSVHDLGYIHNEKTNETVVFDCNPLESNLFQAQHKTTFDSEEIRANLVCSGSMLLERDRSDGLNSDTIVHYHMLSTNRLMLFENNLTQSLNDRTPNVVTFALNLSSEVHNQFLNLFYINTLGENVFMVFGTRCWLNVVTYKNFGEKSLLRPLIHSNNFNFKGDRLFFHAGKKVSKLPDQNTDAIFGEDLIVDVRKMTHQPHTYKMIVFNASKHTMSFYQINLGSCNDVNLVELPYVHSAQGFAQRSISSILSLLTRKPIVIAAAQLDDDKVVTLYSDNTLVVDDYGGDSVRDEIYKEVLPAKVCVGDSRGNVSISSATAIKEQSNSFVKVIKCDNDLHVFVYHSGSLYAYNYSCDARRWYALTSVDYPAVVTNVMDCVVVATLPPNVNSTSDVNNSSLFNDNTNTSTTSMSMGDNTPREYALVIVGTTENDQVCYCCAYFYLRKKPLSLEMIFVSKFELLENDSLHTSQDIHKLLTLFDSVDDIHSYFLFKIFANSSIMFESIVRTLEKYGKSYGAIKSVITHNNRITTSNIKSVLVEIVEKEIASKFGNVNCFSAEASRSLGSTSCMLDESNTPKCSPCVVALQVWQRIYMTILTANTELVSLIYTIPSQLYHYVKFGGYIINTFDLCGLRVFSLLDSFKLLKKNTHRRQPTNVILDCSKIIDIPATYVVFKNLQHITNQTSRMVNDLSSMTKSYTNNSETHFKSVCEFFKTLLDTSSSLNSSLNSNNDNVFMADIEKEHTDEMFQLFQLFIERDNITRCYHRMWWMSDRQVESDTLDNSLSKHSFDDGYSILSKMLNSHLNSFCWYQFLIASQLLMVYYSVFENEIDCDVTLVPSVAITAHDNNVLLKYKTLVQQVHVLFNYYGQCLKLCTDWMCAPFGCNDNESSFGERTNPKNSAFLSSTDYTFNLQPLNEVLEGCHGVKQWVASATPMELICANYVNCVVLSATSNSRSVTTVMDSFFTPLVSKWLYNSGHYEQTLFHCYSMISLCYQTRCFDGVVADRSSHFTSALDDIDKCCRRFNGYILQLELHIARTYIKMKNYNSAKTFYKELLLTLTNLMVNAQLVTSTELSRYDDEFFCDFLDGMIADFVSAKPPQPTLLLELVNAGLSAPVFKVSSALDSTHIDHTDDHVDEQHINVDGDINDNTTYNKLLHAKFMCYIHMSDYRSALDLLSLFYSDVNKKLQKMTTLCTAIMESNDQLCDINFGELLPLVVNVLKQIIVDVSSHDLIISFSKQACAFGVAIELFELAAFFCLTAYYKLYDGCLMKYWSVDRKTVEAMSYFAHSLHSLVVGGTCAEPSNAVTLPLLVSHDDSTVQLMINEFHITPKALIYLADVEHMVIFCDTCLAIENKLKTLQFLPGLFPLVQPVEMVKYLLKYNMLGVAFNYAYNDVDLLQYVLNAIALHEIAVECADVGSGGGGGAGMSSVRTASDSGTLQQCCYQIVADHKPTQLLCNVVRVYLAKQIGVPEWLEHTIAQNNMSNLIQTYLLELRLDKAAQWCASMLDAVTANHTQYSGRCVNSYLYLAELTFTRLDYIVKHTADPNDAITMNAVLNRLGDSIDNYKRCIVVATSDIIAHVNSV